MTRPGTLYVGETWHRRAKPRPHSFRYRVFELLLDIDRLESAVEGLFMLSLGPFGLLSFNERDHGYRDGRSLRIWVEDRLIQAGLSVEARRIELLTLPRVLGFGFNPISVFFIHDAKSQLVAIIYEVNNTFGQTHAYVVPAGPGTALRHRASKQLYVSPFYPVEGQYHFVIDPPGEQFRLVIVKSDKNGKRDFAATLNLARQPLTNRALFIQWLALPLVSLKVVLAIHWEALRLWMKGAPFGARPMGPRQGTSLGLSDCTERG